MVGLERTILPAIAEQEFALMARTAVLSFIVVFGLSKALTNYLAGRLSDRFGRKHVLVAGWLVAVPVPLLLMWAPSWDWVLFANALLGVSRHRDPQPGRRPQGLLQGVFGVLAGPAHLQAIAIYAVTVDAKQPPEGDAVSGSGCGKERFVGVDGGHRHLLSVGLDERLRGRNQAPMKVHRGNHRGCEAHGSSSPTAGGPTGASRTVGGCTRTKGTRSAR